eukprot:TRINITY_DN1624_c0_g1_i5.p1 TRINITY_DN1624_c0_g1~~TRINITY_DN1624_c0_g1_i5.p1  ORF type:complete len:428 (-),score=62.85 TRINITY_DN1624_c0_g1_i5:456-1739(-)
MKTLLEKRRTPVETRNVPPPKPAQKPSLRTLSTTREPALNISKGRPPLQPLSMAQKVTPNSAKSISKDPKSLRTFSSVPRLSEPKPKTTPIQLPGSQKQRKLNNAKELSTPVAIKHHSAILESGDGYSARASKVIAPPNTEETFKYPWMAQLSDKTPIRFDIPKASSSTERKRRLRADELLTDNLNELDSVMNSLLGNQKRAFNSQTPPLLFEDDKVTAVIQTHLPEQQVFRQEESLIESKVDFSAVDQIANVFNNYMSHIGASLSAINQKLNSQEPSFQTLKSKRLDITFYVDFALTEFNTSDGPACFRFSLCKFTNQLRCSITDDVHNDYRTFVFKPNSILTEDQLWQRDVIHSLFTKADLIHLGISSKVTFFLDDEFQQMIGILECLLRSDIEVHKEFEAYQFKLIIFDHLNELVEGINPNTFS